MQLGLLFDNLKDVLERQLSAMQDGKTGWMFGYRIHPITGARQLHNGVDLPNPSGTPIKAIADGAVKSLWIDAKYGGGNSLLLNHFNGPFVTTGYAHLKGWVEGIKVGDSVAKGDVIAYVGSSGRSTGPHLHFTARKIVDGVSKCVDPLPELCVSAGVVELPEHPVG